MIGLDSFPPNTPAIAVQFETKVIKFISLWQFFLIGSIIWEQREGRINWLKPLYDFHLQGKPDLMTEEAWSIDSAFEFFVNKLHEYNMKPKDGHMESPSDVMDIGRDDDKVFPDDGEEKDRYREEGEWVKIPLMYPAFTVNKL